METGDDESLTFMNKGFLSKDVLEQCRKLDEAGISYNFKSREKFEEEIDNGEMLEYAMYSGNYYGTPKSAVEKKLAQGKDVVLDIEINGARSVSRLMPEAVLVYILPPDMAELPSPDGAFLLWRKPQRRK